MNRCNLEFISQRSKLQRAPALLPQSSSQFSLTLLQLAHWIPPFFCIFIPPFLLSEQRKKPSEPNTRPHIRNCFTFAACCLISSGWRWCGGSCEPWLCVLDSNKFLTEVILTTLIKIIKSTQACADLKWALQEMKIWPFKDLWCLFYIANSLWEREGSLNLSDCRYNSVSESVTSWYHKNGTNMNHLTSTDVS